MTTSHERLSTNGTTPARGAQAARGVQSAVAIGLGLAMGLAMALAACASAEAPPAPAPGGSPAPSRAARADDTAAREAGPDAAYAPAASASASAPAGAIAAGEARGDPQARFAERDEATPGASSVVAQGAGVARTPRPGRPTRHQWLPFPIEGRRVIAEPTLRGLPGESADVVPRVLGEPLPEPEPPLDAAGRPTIPIGDASTPYAPRQAN